MKGLLFVSAILWAGMILLTKGNHDHASVMGMLTFIGYLILDKLDSRRDAA